MSQVDLEELRALIADKHKSMIGKPIFPPLIDVIMAKVEASLIEARIDELQKWYRLYIPTYSPQGRSVRLRIKRYKAKLAKLEAGDAI